MKAKGVIRQEANAQVPISDYVPLGSHVSDNVIRLRHGGEYIACWKLDGISFETADPEYILARKEALNNLVRALGGGSFALWTHRCRRVVRERLTGVYSTPFCQAFDESYNAAFDKHRQMATELYVTLVYRPPNRNVPSIFKRMANRTLDEIRASTDEALSVIADYGKQLESSLARYEPTRLALYSKNGVTYSEMAAFYGYLINGVWEDIPLKKCRLNEYLPSSRLHFGDQNGMLEIWHPTARKFVGFLDFQDYPQYSEPGMNNGIMYGDYEFIETQSFSILNKRDAMSALDRQRGQLIATEDASETEIADMQAAKNDLQSGLIEFGEYHYSLAIFGNTLDQVAKNIAEARTVLQDGPGFKMALIDAIPECAWFAQLPGNWSLRPREASITSRNFICLSPFHNFARGKRHGNPWGEALALFKTPSGQPFYFNFHVSPEDEDSTDKKLPGNTFICGSTGVGKTVVEMSLLAFATKYAGLRSVFFDKDRGAEIAIRAMGGKYFPLKRGKPTGFNPFQFSINEHNIQFCERLLKQLAGKTTAAEENEINQAVRTVMNEQVDLNLRRLSSVYQNLRSNGDLRVRLRKWIGNESLGWVFDNPRDTQDFSGSSLFGYDYTEFLDDPEVRTPIMAYLLHITETLIDGQPFIYFMEEFWKPLMDEMFSDFAKNKQKTIRKQNGLGVFVTQSPSDVLDHPIGKTMVEQSVTQIYLPNPRADHDDYVHGFKVTEAEYNIIRNLGEQSRMFLVKQGHQSAIVSFNLGGMDEFLNVLSGTTDNVELLDQIREEVGDDPSTWLPILHQRIRNRVRLIK